MNPLDDILGTDHGTPCLSLYQPTHRSFPDNRQDPIRFRNLVKTLDERLREADPAADANALLAPFHALAEDRDFWNHAQDALAVLGAPGSFRVMRLQRPVGELAVVADSFHVKPLLRIVQSADRYQVLGLSRDDVSLFAGNRDALDEVELDAAVSDVVANALGAPRERPKSSVWTYRAGASGLQSGAAVRHGIGSEKGDLIARETEKLFREVDRAIVQVYSRRSGLPLVLAGLPEHQALFRRVSRNPFLLPDGIDVNPGTLSLEELRERAWRTVEPHYLARLAGLVEIFGTARARALGSDDLDANFQAVLDGATGNFKDMYAQSSEQLRQLLVDNQATAEGVVIEAGIKSATTTKVEVLLFVDQTVTNAVTPEPRLDRSRVVMTMELVDGRWLASDVVLP